MGRNDREIKREAVMNWEENRAREVYEKLGPGYVNEGCQYDIADAFRTTYQEGARDMREKARVTCRSVIREENERTRGVWSDHGYQIGARCCEDAIAALPLSPDDGGE